MRDLVIFGATELAGMVRFYAMVEHGLNVAAFVVDEGYRTQERFHGIPVVEWQEMQTLFTPATTDCFVALGYRLMRRRREVYERVTGAGYHCINLISPASYVASGVHVGENNLIFPGVVIEPGVSLGANNIIWSNATICHDAMIGSHNFVAANVTLGGHAHLGDANFVGFSATILQHISVGNEVLVGAQSLVRDTTRDLHQYWGVPAIERGAIDAAEGICVE